MPPSNPAKSSLLRVVRQGDRDYQAQLDRAASGGSLFDPQIETRAREILERVREEGDKALSEFTERFDGARLSAEQFRVSAAEFLTASLTAEPEFRQAVAEADKNVSAFAKKSARRDWSMRNCHGAEVGEKFDPYTRVGVYIPGGTAPLASTAIMTVSLARSAGCPEIVVCTPAGRDGSVNPALLFAANSAGATEIYKVGGAQAIASMAFGTATIRPVQKIFGPGNAYVVAAKRLLFGRVGIDLLSGPSEILVLADDSAKARWVAADLLAQAEHGSGKERVWLVTTSKRLARDVLGEIKRQLPKLPRNEYVRTALAANGWVIIVEDLNEGIDVANLLAPEHCEVMTRQAAKISRRLVTAGAIFLGPHSPTVVGDYVARPSHTLPTGGASRSFSGLTVDQFQRRTSVVSYDRSALRRALGTVGTFARLEGLEAHGRSAEMRFEKGAS